MSNKKLVAILDMKSAPLPQAYAEAGAESTYEVLMATSLAQLKELIKVYHFGVVLFYIVNKEDMVTILQFLDDYSQEIRQGTIKVAGLNLTTSKKAPEILKKHRVTEIFPEAISIRSLKFKLDLWFKGIDSAVLKFYPAGVEVSKPKLLKPTGGDEKVLLTSTEKSLNEVDSISKKLDQLISADVSPQIQMPKGKPIPPASTLPPEGEVLGGKFISFATVEMHTEGKFQKDDEKWRVFRSIQFMDLIGRKIMCRVNADHQIAAGNQTEVVISYQYGRDKGEYRINGIVSEIEKEDESKMSNILIDIQTSQPQALDGLMDIFSERQENIMKFFQVAKGY